MESVKIAVDMREPEEMVSLITGLGVSAERKVFTPGDYVLSAEYAAERKTVADFMSSMFKGTLFEQLETLKEVYPKPLLILEGDIASRLRGRKNPRSFWGGLLRIQVDMGVPVLPTPTFHHTAELLCTLAKRLQRRRVERIAVQHKPRLLTEGAWQVYAVASLPSIGGELASRLLDRFGTVRKVFMASASELEGVPGIGMVRAERVCKILDLSFQKTTSPSSDGRGPLGGHEAQIKE